MSDLERRRDIEVMHRVCGRTVPDEILDRWVGLLRVIPEQHHGPAVDAALQASASNFLPTPGQVLAVAKERGWVPAKMTTRLSHQQAETAAKRADYEQAVRDRAAHARHLEHGLVPNTCVFCRTAEHRSGKHAGREPFGEPPCFQCAVEGLAAQMRMPVPANTRRRRSGGSHATNAGEPDHG